MALTVPGVASEYRRVGKNVKREMLTPENHYRTLGYTVPKVRADRQLAIGLIVWHGHVRE
jgi:hypothetical protein